MATRRLRESPSAPLQLRPGRWRWACVCSTFASERQRRAARPAASRPRELGLALGRGGLPAAARRDLRRPWPHIRRHALGLRLRAGDPRVQVGDARGPGGTGAEREERGGCHGRSRWRRQAVAAHGDAAGAWDWAVDRRLHPSRSPTGLAGGLAPKDWRYAAVCRDSPPGLLPIGCSAPVVPPLRRVCPRRTRRSRRGIDSELLGIVSRTDDASCPDRSSLQPFLQLRKRYSPAFQPSGGCLVAIAYPAASATADATPAPMRIWRRYGSRASTGP